MNKEDIHICSPLGVVPKKNNKFRLILDLRYLNNHLASLKFKFEDLRIASELLDQGASSPLTYSMVTTTLILEWNTGNTWASPTNLKEGLDTLFLHPSHLGSAQLPVCSQNSCDPWSTTGEEKLRRC